MEAVLRQAPHAVAVLISALLILAAVHKIRVVRRSGGSTEPLIRAYGITGSTLASTVLLVVAAVELGVAGALVAYPQVGYFAAAGLIGLYARALKRLPASQPCACFGEGVLEVSRSTAIARNVLLGTTTFILGVAMAAGYAPDRWRLMASAEAVLLLAAPAIAIYAMRHTLSSPEPAVRPAGADHRYSQLEGHGDVPT